MKNRKTQKPKKNKKWNIKIDINIHTLGSTHICRSKQILEQLRYTNENTHKHTYPGRFRIDYIHKLIHKYKHKDTDKHTKINIHDLKHIQVYTSTE